MLIKPPPANIVSRPPVTFQGRLDIQFVKKNDDGTEDINNKEVKENFVENLKLALIDLIESEKKASNVPQEPPKKANIASRIINKLLCKKETPSQPKTAEKFFTPKTFNNLVESLRKVMHHGEPEDDVLTMKVHENEKIEMVYKGNEYVSPINNFASFNNVYDLLDKAKNAGSVEKFALNTKKKVDDNKISPEENKAVNACVDQFIADI